MSVSMNRLENFVLTGYHSVHSTNHFFGLLHIHANRCPHMHSCVCMYWSALSCRVCALQVCIYDVLCHMHDLNLGGGVGEETLQPMTGTGGESIITHTVVKFSERCYTEVHLQ